MIKKLESLIKIPENTDFDKPFFQMDGTNELLLCGSNSILEYSSSKIKVNVRGIQISIEGSNLIISFIDNDAIAVKGNIRALNFVRVK